NRGGRSDLRFVIGQQRDQQTCSSRIGDLAERKRGGFAYLCILVGQRLHQRAHCAARAQDSQLIGSVASVPSVLALELSQQPRRSRGRLLLYPRKAADRDDEYKKEGAESPKRYVATRCSRLARANRLRCLGVQNHSGQT